MKTSNKWNSQSAGCLHAQSHLHIKGNINWCNRKCSEIQKMFPGSVSKSSVTALCYFTCVLFEERIIDWRNLPISILIWQDNFEIVLFVAKEHVGNFQNFTWRTLERNVFFQFTSLFVNFLKTFVVLWYRYNFGLLDWKLMYFINILGDRRGKYCYSRTAMCWKYWRFDRRAGISAWWCWWHIPDKRCKAGAQ